jgi:hypothetical protein
VSTDQEYKARENSARRAAGRQGLRLEKSRRRNARAPDYGAYWLIQGPAPQWEHGEVVNWRAREIAWPGESGASLDEIESYLAGEAER